ncbi:MAG: hypothetical protein JWL67_1468 [Solirubrobacterales bacterium]|jgi:hypothetical protein|nr:hypothetical protein [Solirubrobacterales bacterium]
MRRLEEAHTAGEDAYDGLSLQQLQRLTITSIAALPRIFAEERLANGIGVKRSGTPSAPHTRRRSKRSTR